MLTDWLAPTPLASFLDTHLQKTPYARPGAAASAVRLLTWEVLGRVLQSERRPLDVLTVAAGQLVETAPPRSEGDVALLMKRGVSVVVRASEAHDSGLGALAASIARELPGEVHVQLYATPGGTNSYGWHYDFEDVFIVQTAGVKDYYFRENTVARHTRLGERLDFSAVRQESSPLMSARLLAGDWLYLPARWWHLVKCAEDSLSISIGVMPPQAFRDAVRVPAGWSGVMAR